ncbi:hypothetical protein [Ruminococcus flavefaciens]|uniref:hypothetical protein n=1 Tax=Ruminococcus flavefaciens TaxID=1265 RepID=UPI00048F0B81|nr:hypothetical protein [Ruminococcus flavefaciens]
MNLNDFVSNVKGRPGAYFGARKMSSLFDIGFFIEGYEYAKRTVGQEDGFDKFFSSEFPKFVRKKLNDEPLKFEFWFETIDRYANDSDEAANMFFSFFEEFYAMYESKTE